MIYVFIPCRLDKEVIPTCFDLINKASNPNNIKIIVFNQDRQSDMFFQDLFPYSLSTVTFDATDTDIQYFTADVSFKYTIYNLTDLNNNAL